jgi:ABC-type polysaccharide/polyol phosphate export permease
MAMSLVERARALWETRAILYLLIVRDLKVRYAGSVLGYMWTILDPLMMTGVYWFIFSVVFTGRRIGEDPYVLFIVMGLLSWQWFSASVTGCSTALGAEARLVRSTRLPREIWVLKVVGSKGAEFLFSLPIVVLFMVLYHRAPSWQLVLVPIAIVLQAILLTGIGLALAPATVLIRDLARVVRIALRVLFYLSPVIYSVRRLEIGPLRRLFQLNPMTGILDIYRSTAFPAEFIGWKAVAVSAVLSLIALVAGAVVFRRLERPVLKEI